MTEWDKVEAWKWHVRLCKGCLGAPLALECTKGLKLYAATEPRRRRERIGVFPECPNFAEPEDAHA